MDKHAQFTSETEYTFNHIYELMNIREINTLTQICEIERTQILKFRL